ncbi:DDE-domain-containing protein [Backusella circina FSU 941]|nr:DDE-domain-containing protein [Backusella circina FSU 941]
MNQVDHTFIKFSWFDQHEILDKNDTGQFSQPELGEWAQKQFDLDEPLAQQTKYKIPEGEVSFSAGRLTKVFKRTGLKSRLTHSENASVDVSSDGIQNQLRKIEELLESYNPANIMNFDETGLYYHKTRLTVGLLCNSDGSYKGHPIVIGKYKSPKYFKTNARLLALTAVGRKYKVEYHYSTNAWMTEKIFTSYILKLDRAFGRQGRKIALLLNNASVHKIRATLDNIKLIFLPAGIIANFKAHFRGWLKLINYCANAYDSYEVLPIVLAFVVGKFANTTIEKKFVRKANTPYILETQCEHWAKSVNFVSAISIQDYIQDSMDPFVALIYFTTSQAQSLESLTFASDLTVRLLYSICQRNMKKKDQSELRQVFDQAINQVLKMVELPAENPAQMLEMSKNIAKELLGTILHQKRKLDSEYDLDQQTLQTQQQKYTAEDFQFIAI